MGAGQGVNVVRRGGQGSARSPRLHLGHFFPAEIPGDAFIAVEDHGPLANEQVIRVFEGRRLLVDYPVSPPLTRVSMRFGLIGSMWAGAA
jgi:hypothetical protein